MTGRPLHAALQNLSGRLGRRPARPTVRHLIERGYAAGVADRVGCGPVTFADRTALLWAGRQLGISPVRASLIIALQQDAPVAIPARRQRFSPILAAILVQAGVIAVAAFAWLA